MRRTFDAAAHLAIWAGMYISAAFVCFAQVAGIDDRKVSSSNWVRALGVSFCIAAAVYLLDRVKLRDQWLDPADAAAHPVRYEFLTTRTGALRVALFSLLLLAIWLGLPLFADSWLLSSILPIAAALGVLLYAARPRGKRDRPKDILMLKNAYVAAGIAAFAAIVALLAAAPLDSVTGISHATDLARSNALALSVSTIHLFVRVFADAVLCDLDDANADAAHGTRTLPLWLGRGKAWNTAMAVRLAISLALAVAAVTVPNAPRIPMLCWAAVTIASSLTLRLWAPEKLRDWVDARFAIEAAVVSMLVYAIARP